MRIFNLSTMLLTELYLAIWKYCPATPIFGPRINTLYDCSIHIDSDFLQARLFSDCHGYTGPVAADNCRHSQGWIYTVHETKSRHIYAAGYKIEYKHRLSAACILRYCRPESEQEGDNVMLSLT